MTSDSAVVPTGVDQAPALVCTDDGRVEGDAPETNRDAYWPTGNRLAMGEKESGFPVYKKTCIYIHILVGGKRSIQLPWPIAINYSLKHYY